MKYKTRLAFVLAIHFTGDNGDEVQDFIGSSGDVRPYNEHELAVLLDKPEGLAVAVVGDYLVKVDDEITVVAEHNFINAYQMADEEDVLDKQLQKLEADNAALTAALASANTEKSTAVANLAATNKANAALEAQVKQLTAQLEATKKPA